MVLGYVSKKPYKEWESFMKIFRVFTTTDRLDPSLLKRSLILWDSFMMKLNTMLRNNIQCTILTTKFILHMFTLLPPFFSLSSSSSSSSSFFFFFLFFFYYIFFTLKMTIAPVSVTVNSNSPIQEYVHPDDHINSTNLWKFIPQSL